MSTLNARANAYVTSSGATWSTTANAVDGVFGATNNTYATFTSLVSAATGYIEVGFGTQLSAAIPANAVITNVAVTIRHLETVVATVPTIRFQPYDGATAIGTIASGTSVVTNHANSATFTPTVAQVRSANFKIRVTATRAAVTTAGNFSLDNVDVVVTYTVPPVSAFSVSTITVVAGDTVTFTDTSTGADPATGWAWDFGAGASPATASTKGPHTVTYSTPGVSTSMLTASNSAGGGGTAYIQITVVPITKAETLVDTFDTEINSTRWPISYGTTAWSAGRAAITERPGAYSGILSLSNAYDLRDSSVFVRATLPPAPTNSTELTLNAYGPTSNDGLFFIIYYDSGQTPAGRVCYRLKTAGVTDNEFDPYDPVMMAFIRVRMSGTNAYWDTSPDGWTWTNRRVQSTALDFRRITVELSIGQWSTETTQGTGYFDNVNTPIPLSGRPKVWNGTAWVNKPSKYWTGSAWVEKPMKTWNGSIWKKVP